MVFDSTLKAVNTLSDDATFSEEDTDSAMEVAELGDKLVHGCGGAHNLLHGGLDFV